MNISVNRDEVKEYGLDRAVKSGGEGGVMRWYIITPQYGTVVPIGLDDGTGPTEYFSDVVEVDAETKREALVLGVRELRRLRSQWLRDSDGNPFTGLKAEPWQE